MPDRMIEILSQGASLKKERGFLVLKRPETDPVKIPLDDIGTLIVGAGVQISTNLILSFYERGSNIVVTGNTYHPAVLMWPHSTHTEHLSRLQLQIDASQPLKKRLWQQVVQSKIRQQAITLRHHTGKEEGLADLANRVRSGDPDNLEAQAARRYWQKLMGTDFRRIPESDQEGDLNILLNYGYAVMRAATARALAACGLHPALGIHHSNKLNTFSLVDDLMEPYRPAVDSLVASLQKSNETHLTPEIKKRLVGLLDIGLINHQGETSPLSTTMIHVAQSLYKSFETGKPELAYPEPIVQTQSLLL